MKNQEKKHSEELKKGENRCPLGFGFWGRDLISQEQADMIDRKEGLSSSSREGMNISERKKMEENIIESLSPEHGEELRNKLNNIHEQLEDGIFHGAISRSYVIITCYDEPLPCMSRIKLRDENETVIQLRPGVNKLTINDYPELKYGFESWFDIEELPAHDQLPESYKKLLEKNGGDVAWFVKSVDLSHFDSSEMTDMNNMFSYGVFEKLDLTNLKTSNVKTMNGAFSFVYIDSLTLKFDTSKVEDMSHMFYAFSTKRLQLIDFDFSHVQYLEGMFTNYEIGHLIFEDCYITKSRINFADGLFRLNYFGSNGIILPDNIQFIECLSDFIIWVVGNVVALIRERLTPYNVGINITQINEGIEWGLNLISLEGDRKIIYTPDDENGWGTDESKHWVDKMKWDISLEGFSVLTESTPEERENGVEDEFGVLYSRDGKKLLSALNARKLRDYTIKDGTIVICNGAFQMNDSLTSIKIPETVIAIGECSFSLCTHLPSITVPSSVKWIGQYAFGTNEWILGKTDSIKEIIYLGDESKIKKG